eukprot:s329_g12.t1
MEFDSRGTLGQMASPVFPVSFQCLSSVFPKFLCYLSRVHNGEAASAFRFFRLSRPNKFLGPSSGATDSFAEQSLAWKTPRSGSIKCTDAFLNLLAGLIGVLAFKTLVQLSFDN